MRSINVSTEIYAAIWAARMKGEEDEDAILGRVFKVERHSKAERAVINSTSGGGVIDGRSGVHFQEGAKIFRTYKGQNFSAVARSGYWVREDNGQRYASLNRLNSSIVAGSENVWNGNWKLRNGSSEVVSINSLRP